MSQFFLQEGSTLSSLVFRYHDPTYNPCTVGGQFCSLEPAGINRPAVPQLSGKALEPGTPWVTNQVFVDWQPLNITPVNHQFYKFVCFFFLFACFLMFHLLLCFYVRLVHFILFYLFTFIVLVYRLLLLQDWFPDFSVYAYIKLFSHLGWSSVRAVFLYFFFYFNVFVFIFILCMLFFEFVYSFNMGIPFGLIPFFAFFILLLQLQ